MRKEGTSPRVYNIVIEHVEEEAPSSREACVKLYTGYGSGYEKGNLRDILISNVLSRGTRYAVMVKADVCRAHIQDVRQASPEGEAICLEGESEKLVVHP